MKKLKLDFSGGQNSWFDFWHTHIDWKGEGNNSWNKREIYLNRLIEKFEYLNNELKDYPNDFQTWIVIDENDSSEDGVYIHTKNPNSDNFPLKIKPNNYSCQNSELKEFIDRTKLEVVEVPYLGGKYFYLFDQNIGTPITD